MPKIVIGIAAVAAMAAPSYGATVIDQSQTVADGPWDVINGPTYTWSQSFMAGYDNSVGAGIYLAVTFPLSAPQSDITLSLLTAPVGSAESNLLASGTVSVGTPDNPLISGMQPSGVFGTWADVSWSQVALTVGSTYYLAMRSSTTEFVAYGNGNSYAGGAIYLNDSNLGDDYDLTFRTFASDGIAGGVPEPATWAMMLIGFGAVGLARRRRSRQVLI